MPGRTYSGNSEYRYGFNGQEKSDEIAPNGNSNTAEFWQYDSRVGKRWNVDPKSRISISPYSAFGNNPIWNMDPDGDTTYLYSKKGHLLDVILDKLKTNKIVVLSDFGLAGYNSYKDTKKYKETSEDDKAAIFRSLKVMGIPLGSRITTNTIMRLTSQWTNSKNEVAGLIYINKTTNEVNVFTCPNCGMEPTGGAAGQADPEKLAEYEDYVNKNLGTIIGAWHTHPANPKFTPFEQAKPSSTKGNGDDYAGPSTYIKTITNGGVGIIVTQNAITIYPVSIHREDQLGSNDKDVPFVNRTKIPPSSPSSKGTTSSWQHGVFDKKISPRTQW